DWSAQGKSGEDITGLRINWVILLGSRVDVSVRWIAWSARSQENALWIVAGISLLATIHAVVFNLHEGRAVVVVAALLHDHIDYTAQSATVLGFNTRALNLNFLDEIEWHVGVRVAA